MRRGMRMEVGDMRRGSMMMEVERGGKGDGEGGGKYGKGRKGGKGEWRGGW
jgi:hypothetical protein